MGSAASTKNDVVVEVKSDARGSRDTKPAPKSQPVAASARVYVTTPDGTAVATLSVQLNMDTVHQLCTRIYETTKTPVQRQQLLLAGRELQRDGRTLAEHGVAAESTLHLKTLGEARSLDVLFTEPDDMVMRVIDMKGSVPGKRGPFIYHGGAFGPDGLLYLTPSNAVRAARFDPKTNTCEAFGDTFPEGDRKWQHGAVSGFDGCLYSFPAQCSVVSRVLKIDPSKGTARQVGGDFMKLEDGLWRWPWVGQVLAADGCYYGTPYLARSVVRFDPRTQKLSTFGHLEQVVFNYCCGVLGPDGRLIFCVPMHASRVLCIDTETQTCDFIGDDFGESDSAKWVSGALGGDDEIYCIPACDIMSRVLRIDPRSKTTTLFGRGLCVRDGWLGAAAGTDGCVYGVPNKSDRVLRIDPFAGTVSTVGKAIPAELQGKFQDALLGPDGAFWCLPCHLPSSILRLETADPARHTPLLKTLLPPAQHQVLREGLSDPHHHGPALAAVLYWEATRVGGNKALVNGILQAAAPVLPRCDLSEENGHLSVVLLLLRALANALPVPQTSLVGEEIPVKGTQDMYSGGAFGTDGHLYLVPSNATRVARLDPESGTWEVFGDVFEGEGKWHKAELSSVDGCIYSFPNKCSAVSRVLQIDPSKGTVRMVGDSVLELGAGAEQELWHGAVMASNGCMYGIPAAANSVSKFDPRTHKLSAFGHVQGDKYKYNDGVLGPAGRFICCVPAGAARVLCIDTHTDTCEVIGDDLDENMKWKWKGGGLGGDGLIYCVPLNAGIRVLRIDPVSKTTSLFGPVLGHRPMSWAGGAAGADGCVYGVPCESNHILQINPFTGTVSTLSAPIPTKVQHTLNAAVRGPKGNVWCPPNRLPSRVMKIATPSMPAPFEPLHALIANPEAFETCLFLDSLRKVFVPLLLHHAHLYQPPASASPTAQLPSNRLAIPQHFQKERPELLAALQETRVLPLSVSGLDFVSCIAQSSGIRLAPVPNKWTPLPPSVDNWSWPPPPLAPLRAACKIAQEGGPDAVEAAWPALSQAVMGLLLTMVDAVSADLPRATKMLREVFDRERMRSLETYRKQLRRARRDPTYPEFKAVAAYVSGKCAEDNRQKHRVQTISSFPRLYTVAYHLSSRFHDFVHELSRRCAGSESLRAPIKGCGRALEKLVLRPGVPAKIKEQGAAAVDARHMVDVLRGSLKCPDFTEITFVLELLLQLDVRMGDPAKAKAAGLDLDKFQIFLIRVNDRFTTPTSGGWADCMVNFRFARDDDTQHVMELQLQHQQMLVVRKEGKAHNQYNSFRSAFELLETVGETPEDTFVEMKEDQSPLEHLQMQMKLMQSQITKLETENQSLQSDNKLLLSRVDKCEVDNQSLQSQLAEYREENQSMLLKIGMKVE